MKVADSTALREGESAILTLKDTAVLDGDSVNDAEDELEDVKMAEAHRHAKARKDAMKRRFDDDDDDDDDDAGGLDGDLLLGGRKKRYVEPAQEETLVLGGATAAAAAAAEGGPSAAEQAVMAQKRAARINMQRNETLAADYLTTEEAGFGRKGKKRSKRSKKQAGARIASLELDDTGAGDLGARQGEADAAEMRHRDEMAAVLEREARFSTAVARAQAKTSLLHADDNELLELEKKKLEEKRAARQAAKERSERLLAMLNSGDGGAGGDGDDGDDQQDARDPLVFSASNEFVKSIRANDEEPDEPAIVRFKRSGQRRAESFADDGDDDVDMDGDVEDSGIKIARPPLEDGEVAERDDDDASKPAGKPAAEAEELLTDQPISRGMAGALAYARSRGVLNERLVVGRSHADNTFLGGGGDDGGSNDRVRLEYLDDDGRELTAKEMFRFISHKFHGRQSSKSKVEQRTKRVKEDLTSRKANIDDTPLHLNSSLNDLRERSATPFVVFSGQHLSKVNLGGATRKK